MLGNEEDHEWLNLPWLNSTTDFRVDTLELLVTGLEAVRSYGVQDGRTWFGTGRDGTSVFVKAQLSDQPYAGLPTVAAELLGAALLRAGGANAISVRAVFAENVRCWYAISPRIPRTATVSPMMTAPSEWEDALDLAELCTLFVLDVIAGNGDRSASNLFFVREGDVVRLVPIDHDLAFVTRPTPKRGLLHVHFVRGFEGLHAGANVSEYQRQLASRCGTVGAIASSNGLYTQLLRRCATEARVRTQLIDSSERVIARLSDRTIEQVIAILPTDVLGATAAEQAKEFRDGLCWRRDHVLAAWKKHTGLRLPCLF